MTDAWRRRDETPWAVAPHGHGKDNVQAAIAFSFFSIITWVNIIMWNYSRRNRKIIFLFLNQNICCGYSKEPYQWDSSFEHPKHMLKNMIKKIFTICLHHITWVNIIMWSYSRRNRKIIYLFLNQNIGCGYSKEPSQWDSSFEHPNHMLKIMGKKIFTILCWSSSWTWQRQYTSSYSFLLFLHHYLGKYHYVELQQV